jgi:hypothetical protein
MFWLTRLHRGQQLFGGHHASLGLWLAFTMIMKRMVLSPLQVSDSLPGRMAVS